LNIETEINFLNPKKITISRDNFNALKLEIDGADEYSDVKAVRIFPLSSPSHFISFKGISDSDKEKAEEQKEEEKTRSPHGKSRGLRTKEIGVIKDTRELDKKSRKILSSELEMNYFMPQITRINKIKSDFGSYTWTVETDKGPRTFEVRYREDVRIVPLNRVLIRDVDGNRYEIPDYSRLDSSSKTVLEKHM